MCLEIQALRTVMTASQTLKLDVENPTEELEKN